MKVSRKRAKIGALSRPHLALRGTTWHKPPPTYTRVHARSKDLWDRHVVHPGPDVVTDAGLRVEEVRGSLDQVGVYVVVVPVDWESRRGLRHQRGSTVSDGSCHVQISAVGRARARLAGKSQRWLAANDLDPARPESPGRGRPRPGSERSTRSSGGGMPPPKLLPGPGATPRRRQMHVGVGGPGAVFWMIVAGFLGMSSFRQGNQAPLPSPMTTENVTNRTVKATLKTVRKTARAPAPDGR